MSTAHESAETEHAEEAGASALGLAPASAVAPTAPLASANQAPYVPGASQPRRRRRTRGKGRRIHYT